jgi:hypothetical protein
MDAESWYVWRESDGKGHKGARLTLGFNAQDAAEQWAEAEDRDDPMPVIIRGLHVIVLVLKEFPPRGAAPERFKVRGRMVPQYTATKLDPVDPPETKREPGRELSLTMDDADGREEAQARAERSALANGGEVDHG